MCAIKLVSLIGIVNIIEVEITEKELNKWGGEVEPVRINRVENKWYTWREAACNSDFAITCGGMHVCI